MVSISSDLAESEAQTTNRRRGEGDALCYESDEEHVRFRILTFTGFVCLDFSYTFILTDCTESLLVYYPDCSVIVKYNFFFIHSQKMSFFLWTHCKKTTNIKRNQIVV